MLESIALSRARRMWGMSARIVDRGPGGAMPAAERSAIIQEIDRLERGQPRDWQDRVRELRHKLGSRHRFQIGYDDWNRGFDSFVIMGEGDSLAEALERAEALQASRDRARSLASVTHPKPPRR